ncbi:RHS repeat protein [Bdellovibrio svalbardensis]|uniref:Teneurin-like YD-shell domain-containing protein n=1 Tax=Bdellovibrio svalbardensis TaxID=2972972 RepID=A0ABT6DHA9_9BACT|nr:RHS repeat-associated core domain-containing protein [Bdellovibrio svalbardensis]MDG0816248.1 hypothetical protein [Bdellovibrio svalbardensis]
MKQFSLSLVIAFFSSFAFAQMSVPPVNAPTAPINAEAGVSGTKRFDILHNIDTSAFPDVGPVSIGYVSVNLPQGVKADTSGCSNGSSPAPGAKIPDCVIIYSWSGLKEGTYTIATDLVLNLSVADMTIPLKIIMSTPLIVSASSEHQQPSTPPSTKLPPTNTQLPGKCNKGVGNPNIPGNSIVNVDNLSLAETIPLVGVPFTLNYSSDRFREDSKVNTKLIGFGGWTPSLVHSFDSKNNIVYEGANSIRKLSGVSKTANGFSLASSNAGEIYLFNSDGLHLRTVDALSGVTRWSFGYDQLKRLVSVTDQFGNLTGIQYSKGVVVVTSPYGLISTLIINDNGFLSHVTNPNNESYNLVTDSKGLLISFQKPGGQATKVTYDSDGFMLRDEGAGGSYIELARSFNQETQTQVVVASNALNQKTTYQTSSVQGGFERTIIESHGGYSKISTRDQDSDGYVDIYGSVYQSKLMGDPRFSFHAPYESQSNLKFANSNINIIKTVSKSAELLDARDPLSLKSLSTVVMLQNDPKRVFTSIYDSAKRLITVKSPLNRIVYQALNNGGLVGSVQIGNLVPTTMTYDSRGRISSVVRGDRAHNLFYDESGNLKSSVDSLGRATAYQYDKSGRIIETHLADGASVLFSYDSNGNVSSITPPNKQAHSFGYNVFELMGSYLPPAIGSRISGSTVYSYNLAKQLSQITRPDGVVVSFEYDAKSGALNKVSSPAGSFQYVYAEKSDLPLKITSPDNVQLSYQYTGNLPLVVSTAGSVSGTISYSYNVDGTLATIRAAGVDGKSVQVGLSYDLDGLLTGVGTLTMTRNNVGAVSATAMGKVTEGVGFNNYGELISSGFFFDKKPLFGMSYNRDKVGRITASQDVTGVSKVVSTYEYDDQGRLTKVARGTELRTYTYDANGNRVGFKSGSKSYTGIYDEQDRLLSYGDSKFEYNDNGDLQTRTDVNPETKETKMTSYTYDVFGNLRKVVLPDGRLIEYVIDGQNRRIGKKINGKVVQAFIYQSQYQIAAEMDGSGRIVKSFVYASKFNVPDYVNYNGRQYRIISDQVGTPKMIVDSSNGQVVESFNCDEFGVSQDGKVSNIIPFGFAGGLYDADTGLVRFGARDYSPVAGKWTTTDPLRFNGGDTNLYGYVLNDPINKIDPMGLQAPGFNPVPPDQGPVDPSDWCDLHPDICSPSKYCAQHPDKCKSPYGNDSSPPFGTPVSPVAPSAYCLIHPGALGCSEMPEPELPNQCPAN